VKKIKLAIVNNFPTTYRIPIFDEFAEDSAFNTRIFFTGTKRHTRGTWTLGDSKAREHTTQLSGIGIRIHDESADRVFFNPGFSRITSWEPDVVLIFGYQDITNWIVALICFLRKIPYVLVADVTSQGGKTVSGRLSLPLVTWMVNHASHLIPSSKTGREFFLNLGESPDRITVIPCVPDIARLFEISDQTHAKGTETRREFGLTDKFVVFFVGRLVEYKGIRELLSAIDTASRIEQNLELLIVGDGPLRFEVEEFCRSHPRGAKFAGPVDQETLHRLYAVADVHVMPSYSEAFGVVCPEALAFGVPSIVTRTSGCADLIVDGENGLLVEPRDASSLSDAILMLASNHAMLENMRTNAPKAVANLTLKQVQGQMKRIVLEAANQIES
jgi:glycosyltransferase involved in cell wall biosynthesis